MSEPSDKMERIFNQALGIDPKEARDAYVRGACEGDEKLLRGVRELLSVHEDAGDIDFLKTRDRDNDEVPARAEVPISRGPGSVIGRYKLLQKVGEGGMGVVYMAEQTEPVNRKVALKIIKLGLDTKQVVARFEAERQALAMMDHPNIAKVLDAGSTDTGRPYFVMELVRGVPITEYCDKNMLSTRQRLELFMPVCNAIQHAHQKGIIHRDIKPSNVMVTLNDGVPHPMVIDFGIAKATNQKLTEKTLFTNHAQMIGTPAYMSPEQAEMSKLDVDTRTDVYSLGVLLYELLTGTTPFPPKELMSVGYGEMQRIIAEQEPPKPSTRMSTMQNQDLTVVARNRSMEVSAIGTVLKGDLDWIVMKALEKDRSHRYETVNALVTDVKRHLNIEPVTAAAPTLSYQIQKFYRRNRTFMRAAATVAALLVVATVVSVWLAARAMRAETQARLAAAIAREVNEFYNEDILEGASPYHGGHKDIRLTEVLAKASRKIEQREFEQPLVEAAIRSSIGQAYLSLSEWEQAEPHLAKSLEILRKTAGSHAVRTIQAAIQLATLYEFTNRAEPARELYEEIYPIQLRAFGEEDPDTLLTMGKVARLRSSRGGFDNELRRFFYRTLGLQIKVLGSGSWITRLTMMNIAARHQACGELSEAEALLDEAVTSAMREHSPGNAETFFPRTRLASVYAAQGRLDEAEALLQQVIQDQQNTLEPHHWLWGDTRITLATEVYHPQHKIPEAVELLVEVFDQGDPRYRSSAVATMRQYLEECRTLGLEKEAKAITERLESTDQDDLTTSLAYNKASTMILGAEGPATDRPDGDSVTGAQSRPPRSSP